jgi:hypothetical protein
MAFTQAGGQPQEAPSRVQWTLYQSRNWEIVPCWHMIGAHIPPSLCTLAWQCLAYGPDGLYWICLSVGLVFIKSLNTYYYRYTVKWRCSQSRVFVYIQPPLNISCGPQIKNPRSPKSGLGLCFMPILNTFKHNVHNRVFLYIYSRIPKTLVDGWRFSPQVPPLPYTRKFIII